MSKLFKEWAQKTVSEYHNQSGMLTGRLHFLTDYNAQKGALLAWNYQQEKIDALLEEIESLEEEIDCLQKGETE